MKLGTPKQKNILGNREHHKEKILFGKQGNKGTWTP